MAFDQDMLRPLNNFFNRRSFRLYLYTTPDSVVEITSPGYFSPNQWIEFRPDDVVQAQTGDGYALFEVTDDITTVRVAINSDLISYPTVLTSDFTAMSGFRYPTDTNAGGYTVSIMPNFPIGGSFRVQDVAGSWTGTEILQVDFGASGYNYQGLTGVDAVFDGEIANDGQTFIYRDPVYGFELL